MCDDKVLQNELDNVKNCSAENHRALYGHNGEIGLVGKVELIQRDLNKIVTNDLPHLEKDMLKVIKILEERSVTWPSLGKGLIQPVVVAVLTAVLVTWLHSVLF